MDECDTATRVMDCGKNANPEMFNNMVAAVDASPMVWIGPFLPKLKYMVQIGGVTASEA